MEYAGQRRAVIKPRPFAPELTVNRLGSQHWHAFAKLPVQVLPAHGGLVRLQAAVVERVQHAFNRYVAGKIPQRSVAAARLGGMPQQTVEHRVQVCAAHICARALVLLGEPRAAVIQRAGIRCERRSIVPVRDGQRGQRRIQKGQAHIQLGAGGKQNFPPDFLPAFTLCHT